MKIEKEESVASKDIEVIGTLIHEPHDFVIQELMDQKLKERASIIDELKKSSLSVVE